MNLSDDNNLVAVNTTADLAASVRLPAIIEAAGPRAKEKFLEFFTAHIRNPNTRRAYLRACTRFLDWCHQRGFDLEHVRPMVVAAFIEQLGREVTLTGIERIRI